MKPQCPECGVEMQLGKDVVLSEVINCAECDAELEVIATAPVELVLAPEIEEDWGE